MFRQEDCRRVYPDIDLSPVPPSRNQSNMALNKMSRSFSSGMSLDDLMTTDLESLAGDESNNNDVAGGLQNTRHRLSADSLPVIPGRRGSVAVSDASSSHHTTYIKQPQKNKSFRRSRSSGPSLGTLQKTVSKASLIPLVDEEERRELRRQNSANSIRCLATAAVPRRPSVRDQEELEALEYAQAKMEKAKRRTTRRRVSQEETKVSPNNNIKNDRVPRHLRRNKSADDIRRRMKREDDGPELHNYYEPRHRQHYPEEQEERRVINSRAAQQRRGRSREPGSKMNRYAVIDQQEEDFQGGVPSAINVVRRGHSCGGRIPCSVNVVAVAPVSLEDDYVAAANDLEKKHHMDNSSRRSSYTTTAGEGDDDQSCDSCSSSSSGSSYDQFDEEGLDMVGNKFENSFNSGNRSQVSGLTRDMNWRNSDGSISNVNSAENRDAIQKRLSDAMSCLSVLSSDSGKEDQGSPKPPTRGGTRHQHHHQKKKHHQHQQNQAMQPVQRDDSRRTEATAPMSTYDCGGSVVSGMTGVSQSVSQFMNGNASYCPSHFQGQQSVAGSQMMGNQMMMNMRPWICLCGEDNEPDFNFCGMCAMPQKWTCSSCNFNRNKNRAPHCGQCGLRREGEGGNGTVGHRQGMMHMQPMQQNIMSSNMSMNSSMMQPQGIMYMHPMQQNMHMNSNMSMNTTMMQPMQQNMNMQQPMQQNMSMQQPLQQNMNMQQPMQQNMPMNPSNMKATDASHRSQRSALPYGNQPMTAPAS